MASSSLDAMCSFMAAFRALRDEKRADRLASMKGFLSTFEETHRRIWRTKVDFNLFNLLGIQTDEVRHSALLAWLLAPKSGHGQGDLFMRVFIELCSLDLADAALDRYTVRTEFAGEESIVDVMVSAHAQFVIYIENKVLAAEGPDQADRELRDLRRLGAALSVPRRRQYAVFLTPQGRRPTSGDPTRWRTLSYRDLTAAFTKTLPSVTSLRVRMVLEQWLDAVSGFWRSTP